MGLTDPDCVLLIGKGGEALAGYNVQQAVDAQHKFIVAHEVTTQRNDHASFEPMARQAREALQAQALTAVADTGYMNGRQAQGCEEQGITPVMPMPQPTHSKAPGCLPKTLFTYDRASDASRSREPVAQALQTFPWPSDRLLHHARVCAVRVEGAVHARGIPQHRTLLVCRCCGTGSCTCPAAPRSDAHPRLERRTPLWQYKAMLNGAFALRTLPKVKGEMALAVLTYNLKRAANVLGIERLIERLWLDTAWAATHA